MFENDLEYTSALLPNPLFYVFMKLHMTAQPRLTLYFLNATRMDPS